MARLILVVEDDPDDEKLTVRSLKGANTGCMIVIARDGSEAVEYLFGGRLLDGMSEHALPDIILLDLKLPKINGKEVLQRIRVHPATKSIPVIAMSSSDESMDIVDCYRIGVNSYVCKPVDYTEFTDTVRNIASYWLNTNRVPDSPMPAGIK